MDDNITFQKELTETIPNPVGVPLQSEDSEQLRKEHNRWKDEINERNDDSRPTTAYWKNMSSCAAL